MDLKFRLLIVDDEPDARFLAEDILSGNDYLVHAAESAKNALQVLSTEEIDVVLTDIKMPGDDGLTLLKKIKSQYPDLPVILLTGHGDKSTAIEAIREGAFDFLEKPFEEDEILSAVRRATEVIGLRGKLKEARARSIESDKLATLGLMAGGIAHEINSPLNTILLMATAIKEEIQVNPPNYEVLSQVSDQISQTVMRISKIIKSLQSFARDSSNAPFVDVGVKEIIDNVVNLCGKRFEKEDVQLLLDESLNSNYIIQCRETEIAQVLFNLVTNSHDAVKEIEERWVKVGAKELGDTIQLIVTDSGKGIPQDVASKIFLPFYTTKDIGKGTGLGLSVSVGIIEAHSGSLEIDSNAPNTTFIVSLPKVQTLVKAA